MDTKNTMKHFVNDHITKEKTTMPSPFLAERIMQSINNIEESSANKLTGNVLRQTLAAVASVAAAILLGVAIGNSYEIIMPYEPETLISGSYTEMLNFYQNFPG
jgi:hypothetical protein